MPKSETRLSQRLRRTAATAVTFLWALSVAAADPPALEGLAPATNDEQPTLTLISPLEGLWEPQPAAAAATYDLLARLRYGFILEHEDRRRIRAERDWFIKHPDYLNRVFTRAQRYLPHITAELDRRGLPLELALLPIVESAYDPFAYSHGRAAGLWQMIPGTARRFGLKQNWWYDGRRDIVDSTRAQLDYPAHL